VARALLAALIAVATCTTADATTWRVPGDFDTIQEAVTAAAFHDTVLLNDQTFMGEGNRDIDFGGKPVIVRSEGGDPRSCVIDASGGEHALVFGSHETIQTLVEGVTLTGATAGGAVSFTNSQGTIRNCVIRGCVSCAVKCYQGSPQLVDCRFEDNTRSGLAAAVMDCAYDCSPTLDNCTVLGNEGEWLFHMTQTSNPALTNCTIAANTCNCVFSTYRSQADLERCIIAFNSGATVLSGEGTTIECCDIYEDDPGGVLDQMGCCGNFSLDPMFCDAAAGDLRIYDVSPCAAPGNPDCGLIGSSDVGCQMTPIEALTWGVLKDLYRR